MLLLEVDVYQDWCGPSSVLYKVLESVQPKVFNTILYKSVKYLFLNIYIYLNKIFLNRLLMWILNLQQKNLALNVVVAFILFINFIHLI